MADLQSIPHDALREAGFQIAGRFAHSENWVGPEQVPVQFTDDRELLAAIERAVEIELTDIQLRVIGESDAP